MTDLSFKFIEQVKNVRTYELFDNVNIRVASHGKNAYQDMNEITISFINTETGEAPIINLHGIKYTVNYATGGIRDGGTFARVFNLDIRRSEDGYLGTPPTQKARSEIYQLIRNVLEDTADSVWIEDFLGAGQQLKAISNIERIEKEISDTINKYREKIKVLNGMLSEQGDVAGLVSDNKVRFNVWGIL